MIVIDIRPNKTLLENKLYFSFENEILFNIINRRTNRVKFYNNPF